LIGDAEAEARAVRDGRDDAAAVDRDRPAGGGTARRALRTADADEGHEHPCQEDESADAGELHDTAYTLLRGRRVTAARCLHSCEGQAEACPSVKLLRAPSRTSRDTAASCWESSAPPAG